MKWIKTLVGVSIGILFLVLMSYLYDIISSYQPHYAPEQLAPWNVCGIIHPNLTTIQQEQQAQSTQSLNGLSVSLIGRVVDVRDNPMDGVYIILASPVAKTDTVIYAKVPADYAHRPLPEELHKGDVIKLLGQYREACQIIQGTFVSDVAVEVFEVAHDL